MARFKYTLRHKLFVPIMILFAMAACLPLFARPNRVTTAGEITVIEQDITNVQNDITNITNIYQTEPNDSNNVIITPPSNNGKGKAKVKPPDGTTATTWFEIGDDQAQDVGITFKGNAYDLSFGVDDSNDTLTVFMGDNLDVGVDANEVFVIDLSTGRVTFVNPIVFKAVAYEGLYDFGDVNGVITVDPDNGNMQVLTLNANGTIAFTAPDGPTQFTLIAKQDASGAHTLAWPAATLFSSATAPTMTADASARDYFYINYDGTVFSVTVSPNHGVVP